jgi:hypothetical protein
MAYNIEYREDLACVVTGVSDDFDIYEELPVFCRKIYEILDSADRPIRYICEVGQSASTNLDDLVMAINMLVRGEYPFATHKNFRELVLVTGDRLTEMAVKGMNSDAFGNVHVEVFASMQEALGHAQAH